MLSFIIVHNLNQAILKSHVLSSSFNTTSFGLVLGNNPLFNITILTLLLFKSPLHVLYQKAQSKSLN